MVLNQFSIHAKVTQNTRKMNYLNVSLIIFIVSCSFTNSIPTDCMGTQNLLQDDSILPITFALVDWTSGTCPNNITGSYEQIPSFYITIDRNGRVWIQKLYKNSKDPLGCDRSPLCWMDSKIDYTSFTMSPMKESNCIEGMKEISIDYGKFFPLYILWNCFKDFDPYEHSYIIQIIDKTRKTDSRGSHSSDINAMWSSFMNLSQSRGFMSKRALDEPDLLPCVMTCGEELLVLNTDLIIVMSLLALGIIGLLICLK